MTFDEVIKLARSKGYTFAITGSGTYDICEFAKNFKDEKIETYKIEDDGTLTYFKDDMNWLINVRFSRLGLVR
ncbi:hypothetical protein JCM16163A_40790 [Paenibacillus sp. YK5]|uniref:hypothetical protein n=1 Tax=Paenibacillus naphthalenovorans TaxID=162209 RepID=UPI0010B98B91|nr:hypothetical protein [Paenibacillus naphthalenovorans]GCL71816.1 hypothetical protein PN4B1_17210 [Paenibacillus naphthalenovorans]